MRSLHGQTTSLLAAALCVALCGGCSTTPGLTLQATPASIGGDGLSPITVTAHVTKGGIAADAQSVHFTTSLGSFVGGTGQAIDVDSQSGDATATLTAPRQGRGQITFTASASIDGQHPSANATVALTPQGGPASSLGFTCARQNIGALISGRLTPVHVQCTAIAYDARKQPIPNASIETMTEAGTLSWLSDDQGKAIFVYTVDPGAPPPLDVQPLDGNGQPQDVCPAACNKDPRSSSCIGEPCWLDSTGITHNPRDGVATLVAAVPGPSGPDDQGEPYVDADDNGQHAATEQFIDFNGNGKWDPADGSTKSHMIWQAVRVVWSGDADLTKNAPPVSLLKYTVGAASSGPGETAIGKLYLNDKNLNALAADSVGGTDSVTFQAGTCTLNGAVTVAGDGSLSQEPGILFKATDGSISTPGLHDTYLQHTDYDFSVHFTGDKGQTCNLAATGARSYDPGAPTYDPSGSATDTLSADIPF